MQSVLKLHYWDFTSKILRREISKKGKKSIYKKNDIIPHYSYKTFRNNNKIK